MKLLKDFLNESLKSEYQIKDGVKYKVILKDRDDIKPGDTILVDGSLKTVSKKDIKKDGVVGITIFGNSYRNGLDKVEYCEIYNAK